MKVDPNSAGSLQPLGASRPPQADAPAADSTKGVVDTTVFVPTATLAGLLAQVHGLPETRDDVIRQVRDRLTKGDLLTPAASAGAAQAIIGTETPGN